MWLRIPNVTCCHFMSKLTSASGYHGHLSTMMRGLLLRVSKTLRKKASIFTILRWHEMRHASTSLFFASSETAQTKICLPLSFSFVSSTAIIFLHLLSGFGNSSFNFLNHRRTASWLKLAKSLKTWTVLYMRARRNRVRWIESWEVSCSNIKLQTSQPYPPKPKRVQNNIAKRKSMNKNKNLTTPNSITKKYLRRWVREIKTI